MGPVSENEFSKSEFSKTENFRNLPTPTFAPKVCYLLQFYQGWDFPWDFGLILQSIVYRDRNAILLMNIRLVWGKRLHFPGACLPDRSNYLGRAVLPFFCSATRSSLKDSKKRRGGAAPQCSLVSRVVRFSDTAPTGCPALGRATEAENGAASEPIC